MSKKFKITETGPDEEGFVSVGIGESVRFWFSSKEKLIEEGDFAIKCNQRANLLLEELKDEDIVRVIVSPYMYIERDGRFVKSDLLKNELV